MTTFPLAGQSSGDFRETSARVQLLHAGLRNSVGLLTPDAFTQANPPIVTTTAYKSSTLASISKVGVLGSTIAFTRPDVGNNYMGGPILIAAAYVAGQKPLGIFLNDALGNPYENTPGVASGRGPYVCGYGCVALSLYETKVQLGGSAGNAITYAVGDKLFAGPNGLVTNVLADAYEYNVPAQNDIKYVTTIGIVKAIPDANSALLVIDLRV